MNSTVKSVLAAIGGAVALFLGLVFSAVLLWGALAMALVVGVMIWWQMRRLESRAAAAYARQKARKEPGIIEGEYTVIEVQRTEKTKDGPRH